MGSFREETLIFFFFFPYFVFLCLFVFLGGYGFTWTVCHASFWSAFDNFGWVVLKKIDFWTEFGFDHPLSWIWVQENALLYRGIILYKKNTLMCIKFETNKFQIILGIIFFKVCIFKLLQYLFSNNNPPPLCNRMLGVPSSFSLSDLRIWQFSEKYTICIRDKKIAL